jgi:hypothetical protein
VPLILEVKAGPMAGRNLAVRPGETVSVGRDPHRSNFAIPHDSFMSGLHLTVKHDSQGFRVCDQKSSNGTFLNGARITEAILKNGDEIRTGQTAFSVQIVPDEQPASAQSAKPAAPVPQNIPEIARPPIAPPVTPAESPLVTSKKLPSGPSEKPSDSSAPASLQQSVKPLSSQKPPVAPEPAPKSHGPAAKGLILSVGSWAFTHLPEGWEVKEEFGMQCARKDRFPSTVTVAEEMLPGEPALQHFVESQVSMLRQYLREPKIEAVLPPPISGVEERAAVEVRYATKDGETIFFRRVYARRGRLVGTITLTTLEKELAEVQQAFDAITTGAKFESHGAV